MSNTVFSLWVRLLRYISPYRRLQCVMLLCVMVASVFADILSIGILLPFLSLLLSPEDAHQSIFLIELAGLLGVATTSLSLGVLSAYVVFFAICSGVSRLCLIWLQARISASIGGDLSTLVFDKTLRKEYSYHSTMNSSFIISGVDKASSLVGGLIQPTAQIISSALLILTTFAIAASYQPWLSFAAVGMIGLIYFLLIICLKPALTKSSGVIGQKSAHLIKIVQEGLGAVKEVKLNSLEHYFVSKYSKAQLSFQRASADVQLISSSPKYLLETIVFCLMATLAYNFSDSFEQGSELLPVLGAATIGAQKLLPAFQQTYYAWSAIQGGKASAMDALEFLSLDPGIKERSQRLDILEFNNKIRLQDVSFRYSNDAHSVIQNVTLDVSKGDILGLIGPSGSGKSTLMDIMMGLKFPDNGKITIDDVQLNQLNVSAWHQIISHVPQSIFLLDGTAEENIAFGIENSSIDKYRVRTLMEQLQLDELGTETIPFETTQVGERGRMVSGGQAQRIGIARALYRNANVLFFDEATSALDHVNERKFIEVVKNISPNVTIILIAHDSSLLDFCNVRLDVKSGKVERADL